MLAVLIALILAVPTESPPDTDAALAALELDRFEGKVVLVDFWASWCGPCAASFPWMSEMVEQYGERGFVVVAVNLDEDREAADAFLAGHDKRFVNVFDPDGRIASAFGVDAMPSSILFDRDGEPVYRHAGFFLEERAGYEAHIVELIDGKGKADASLLAGDQRRGGIEAWQRGRLARRDMLLGGDGMELEFDDHIYFSKEASSGGRGFGGGGCGCN